MGYRLGAAAIISLLLYPTWTPCGSSGASLRYNVKLGQTTQGAWLAWSATAARIRRHAYNLSMGWRCNQQRQPAATTLDVQPRQASRRVKRLAVGQRIGFRPGPSPSIHPHH
ncbi:hypothetical protein GQ53DRAFT_742209 [Thozetella sp. PMI_491]|nr:hypothetical protein GQ53DRAFT_742209 [Thozetella sp. PMI_491]